MHRYTTLIHFPLYWYSSSSTLSSTILLLFISYNHYNHILPLFYFSFNESVVIQDRHYFTLNTNQNTQKTELNLVWLQTQSRNDYTYNAELWIQKLFCFLCSVFFRISDVESFFWTVFSLLDRFPGKGHRPHHHSPVKVLFPRISTIDQTKPTFRLDHCQSL